MENPPISRVIRSKEDARSTYDRLSRWYDAIAGSSEKKYRDLGLHKLNAQKGERILEIGFGTGHCILTMAEAVGPEGKVYGIDISEGMLAITRQRIAQAGLADRVELHVGDALDMTHDFGPVDAVFMSFTLELFDTPEIPRLLRQCHAALKPSGRIVVVSLIKKPGTAVKIYEWFHERMPKYVDCRPILAQSDLVNAGFHICDATALSMWGLPVEIILAEKAGLS